MNFTSYFREKRKIKQRKHKITEKRTFNPFNFARTKSDLAFATSIEQYV
jgi:hypothetical protein